MDRFITFMPIHPQKTWDYWALKIIKDNMEKRNGGGGVRHTFLQVTVIEYYSWPMLNSPHIYPHTLI